ncbi:hypothetical protein RQP46_004378 [Phenoliferia psychrophenolica]
MSTRFSAPVKPQLHLGPLTIPRLVKWTPVLAVWGAAAVGAGMLFLSPIPLFQKVADYFTDKTPDSDKPF